MNQDRSAFATVFTQFRLIIVLFLGGLLGVFAFQNMASVELTFLFWTFESRRIVVLAVALTVVLIIGWIIGFSSGRRHSE